MPKIVSKITLQLIWLKYIYSARRITPGKLVLIVV